MNRGKVNSISSSHINRNKSDFYQTPYSLTRLFLNMNDFDKTKTILEPCNGKGAITKILKEYNFKDIITNDINDKEGIDFLKWNEDNKISQIITNPPYRLAYDFVLKCKKVCDRFALLLPLSYLHGKKRYDYIYNVDTFKLKKVYIFTRYPLLTDKVYENGKHKTGMMVYSWFVWDKDYKGLPEINWLDNNSYVLLKKDLKNS